MTTQPLLKYYNGYPTEESMNIFCDWLEEHNQLRRIDFLRNTYTHIAGYDPAADSELIHSSFVKPPSLIFAFHKWRLLLDDVDSKYTDYVVGFVTPIPFSFHCETVFRKIGEINFIWLGEFEENYKAIEAFWDYAAYRCEM